jgi:hypothetical protein
MVVPSVVIAAIAATEIKAAIKPYSIAVAPFSFLKIFLIIFILILLLFIHPGGFVNINRNQFDISSMVTN